MSIENREFSKSVRMNEKINNIKFNTVINKNTLIQNLSKELLYYEN